MRPGPFLGGCAWQRMEDLHGGACIRDFGTPCLAQRNGFVSTVRGAGCERSVQLYHAGALYNQGSSSAQPDV